MPRFRVMVRTDAAPARLVRLGCRLLYLTLLAALRLQRWAVRRAVALVRRARTAVLRLLLGARLGLQRRVRPRSALRRCRPWPRPPGVRAALLARGAPGAARRRAGSSERGAAAPTLPRQQPMEQPVRSA
ncbi:hypothetical protein ACWCP6_15955 [Streptomyces sp. NPDC002004]